MIPRRLAPVAGLIIAALVASCGPGPTAPVASGTPPVLTIDITLRPVPGALPPKPETERASDIWAARLRAIGIGNFSMAAGDVVTLTLPASVDQAAVLDVLRPTGAVSFVPLPPADYPDRFQAVEGQRLPTNPPALFDETGITSARRDTDQAGNSTLLLTLTSEAAAAFGTYTAAHVGESMAIVLDGIVISAPVIRSPIAGGQVTVSSGPQWDAAEVDRLAALIGSGRLPAGWRQGG